MTSRRRRLHAFLIWAALAAVMAVPVLIAAMSPYLAYRNAAYIIGGFAGIIALALLVLQPLLAAGYLPVANILTGRRWHRWTGAVIAVCVALHVGGLYVTSPPDTLDALLLAAPTPFSVYGVLAMWGIVATVILVILRRRSGLAHATWRIVHNVLAAVVVVATVVHALQIEGAMETISKWVLCLAALAATAAALTGLRVIRPLMRQRRKAESQ